MKLKWKTRALLRRGMNFARRLIRALRRKKVTTSSRLCVNSFSVVIPVFNTPGWMIEDAVKSVISQTCSNVGIILVDDGSDDPNTTNALAGLEQNFPVQVKRHLSNVGLSAARNSGLLTCTGDWVLFLDSDDVLDPAIFETLDGVIQASDEPSSAIFGHVKMVQEKFKNRNATATKNLGPVVSSTVSYRNLEGENPAAVHGIVTKRRELIDAGGFDENYLLGAEDFELWDRFIREGRSALKTNCFFGYYRQKQTSMITTGLQQHLFVALGIKQRSISEWGGPRLRPFAHTVPGLGHQILSFSALKRIVRWSGLETSKAQSLEKPNQQAMLSWIQPTVPLSSDRKALEQAARNGYLRGHTGAYSDTARWAIYGDTANRVAADIVESVFAAQRKLFRPKSPRRTNIAVASLRTDHELALSKSFAGQVFRLKLDREGLSHRVFVAESESSLSTTQVLLGWGEVGKLRIDAALRPALNDFLAACGEAGIEVDLID